MIIINGCSSLSPISNIVHETPTITQSPEKTVPAFTETPIPEKPNVCLGMETGWSPESLLDGTIILGNIENQKIYLLSSGDENPQPLLGRDPSWDPGFRLSPDGKWLSHSILSGDGSSFTALKVKSLNGDQVWEIPYQPGWDSQKSWIDSQHIEILKSETEKITAGPFTGAVVFNPFADEEVINLDFGNLKLAETPYYDPTITRMIYLRDDLIPETGDPLFESIVIADIKSGEELWVRAYPGRDLFIAAWSADGKQVAIQDFSELVVVNLDKNWDKILRRDNLKLHPSTLPVWSPDGHYIAIKTYDSLAIYDPINDILTDYCLHDQILGFDWSPNSQQIAVDISLPNGSREILVINCRHP
jgi:hypothetical protein